MPNQDIPSVTLAAQGDQAAIQLPAIGQGTWYMGEGLVPKDQEVKALQQGLELGLRLIDTAEMYGEGAAEKVVGEALRGRRDQAFVVSKVYPWNAGSKGAIKACENSLKRLGIDCLDLYLLHWPGSIPLEETVDAFQRLREQGKIKRFGVSNFDADDMQALYRTSGGSECAVNQVLYHLGSRGIEHSLRPWQREHDMPIMAYCPIAQGGSLRKELLTDSTVEAIANELNATPAQVLLAWAIRPVDRRRDVIAIPKAATSAHVEQNAAALSLQLNDDALARLDEAFPAPQRKTSLDIV
ncbi:aldo/keto reductase [Pistricoccus aurantiacus]|uniref:Aldo/keto reductase n=1 Tax=Pistricoccus aurantiacus TaxID=1883414 RepID=A0A5B8SST1_9GAMM|nr:aldo/keto reductase [Pistricoccus aurantiacus]QEA39344.1 aldo/keto reductase [Pistricoccus aurantiacus]